MIKSNDTIGNRTRDLSACSAVPQATAPPCALVRLNKSTVKVETTKRTPTCCCSDCWVRCSDEMCRMLVVGLNIYSDRGLALWVNQVRVHLARTIVPTNEDAMT
jgi:hypothetical protein